VLTRISSQIMSGSPKAVAWIPDAEVQECPVCSRKFSKTLRKHHCRACGRVICGTCSGHELLLPGSNRKERVCDPCFDIRTHDLTGSLHEDHSVTKVLEQSLKADLKEKHHQAEWFRGFLVRISAQTFGAETENVAITPASDIAGSSASGGDDDEEQLLAAVAPQETQILDAEMQKLISGARKRCQDVCTELRSRQADTTAARRECDKLESECQRLKAEATDLRRSVRSMESDLKRQPAVLVERDQLQLDVRAMEEELAALTQRAVRLEADRPSSSNSFLVSFTGSDGSCNRMRDRIDDCRSSVMQQRCVLM